MSSKNRPMLVKLVDAEDLVREFINHEFTNASTMLSAMIQFDFERISDYNQIVESESLAFAGISEKRNADLIDSGVGRKSLFDQIRLLNGMKIYNMLYQVGKGMGYDLVLFGGWLVRVLAGLSLDGDLDVYCGGHGIIQSQMKFFKSKVEKALPVGLEILEWDTDETINRNGYTIDRIVKCTRIHFSNGIKVDLLTHEPDKYRVDFNVNQLLFSPERGIYRRVAIGNGMSWLSIFMGLYTHSCVSVNLYGKSVDLGKSKIVENIQTGCDQIEKVRDHSVQMVVRYDKMLKKGLSVLNFKPNVTIGGFCPIEGDDIDGLMLKLNCGHSFGVDNLRKHVRELGPSRSQCPCCRTTIVFDVQ